MSEPVHLEEVIEQIDQIAQDDNALSERLTKQRTSNEYDSSYNWNSVPMTYEFYPICQYLPYYTTTTRDPDPATTDIATCGKPCSSDSDCYGDCNLCLNYWQTPFCSWRV